MNYMASPYTPKAVSPRAVASPRSEKDQWDTDWLADQAAGTGPYELALHVLQPERRLSPVLRKKTARSGCGVFPLGRRDPRRK
jgi:hypothetical protein